MTARGALEAARKILGTMEMEGERRRVEASDTLQEGHLQIYGES